MRGLGGFLREGLVVVFLGALGVEGQGELVGPAELEAGFGDGVVTLLGSGVSFGEVGCVGGDLVGDHSFADVIAVG